MYAGSRASVLSTELILLLDNIPRGMSVVSRLLSAVIGSGFGWVFARLKYQELAADPLLGQVVSPLPERWMLYVGVLLFGFAGLRLGRYGLKLVVAAFVGFFVVEFLVPQGFEEVVRLMYILYVVVPFLLVATGALRAISYVPLVPSFGILR